KYGINHRIIRLDWLKEMTLTSLVNRSLDIPKLSPAHLDNREITLKSAAEVWVPNRNGVFIHIAAAIAEVMRVEFIVVGFNAEEAKTFPDNSQEFIDRVNQSLEFSTLTKPKVICYTASFNKKEIVQLGRELNAPFELMWSCYEAGEKMCGKCESCLRFMRAISDENRANKIYK
ncbi:MAG: 7-cyano-7-deazaguanine synthase, partial [Deltaproteobacteria bacterium]